MASRALLFPGPAPPLSHFGVTLLRHVVVTALRYTIYQLGFPPPQAPPIRIHCLRLYLDDRALAAALGGTPEARAVLGALIDPGGVAEAPAGAARLSGTAAFHRARLRLPRFGRLFRLPSLVGAKGPWKSFHSELVRSLPRLRDAFLAEVLASLGRRAARLRGAEAPACLGEQAWRLRAGRRARLEFLGSPDLFTASWRHHPGRAASALAALGDEPVPVRHRLRGCFREHFRAALERLRPFFLTLSEDAARRGLLERADQAFFLPFDLVENLTRPDRPGWLETAVAANQREYESLLGVSSPPEKLPGRSHSLAAPGGPESWHWQPLAPLA